MEQQQEIRGIALPFTVKETARVWRCCEEQVYQMVAAEKVKAIRIGQNARKIWIPASEVARIAAGE